jgi:ubiquinone/menaquinone biosynthesis C-methylase UbiE
MSQQTYDKTYGGSLPENYERYFVPAIGGPVAEDLLQAASLSPGERVLDVACGTGAVTRRAAKQVGDTGSVAGLDVNGGMLAVARSVTPPDLDIDWYETSAEAMPLPDEAFDVVLCQMGVQFIPDKRAALKEMRRVLSPEGRLLLNVPGPTPAPFEILGQALARHIHPDSAAFCHAVFSLHEREEIWNLMNEAGFRDIEIEQAPKKLRVPPPADFLWQYVNSTPLANVVARDSNVTSAALEKDVCAKWEDFVVDGALTFSVQMTTGRGRK